MSFSNTWPVTEHATPLASPPTSLLQLLFPPCQVSNGNMASISVWVLRRHFDACSSWRWPNSQLVLAQGKAIEVVVVVAAAVAMSVVAGINNWLQLVWPPLARTAGQQQVKPSVSIASDTLPVHHGYPMTDSLLVWLDTDGLNLCLCLCLSLSLQPHPRAIHRVWLTNVGKSLCKLRQSKRFTSCPTPTWLLMSLLKLKFLISSL